MDLVLPNLPELMNDRQLPQFTAQVDQSDLDRLAEFHRARLAEKSWLARQSDLRQYLIWSHYQGVEPNHPTSADLCLWLSHMATPGRMNRLKYCPQRHESTLYAGEALAIRSIRRRHSSVKWYLQQVGPNSSNPAADDLVLQQLAGIVRILPSKPKRAPGLTPVELSKVLNAISGDDFIGLRDKLLLSLGFAGALRVSDLAALRIEDIRIQPQGLVLGFEQRKRKAQFNQIAILAGSDPSRCPKILCQQYLALRGWFSGPLFRRANRNGEPTDKALHPTSVARIITKRGAGNVSLHSPLSGHSLRRGFIDSALSTGAPISEVMKISGHQDPKTLMLYLDEIGQFNQHPAQGLY
ncbi:tyrosine-type recombinase/integrase [Ferrimonas pelagia]|uniref:Site-specific integrase n=1 Tax=Ferrimonas pelagia TaxID=1177826 RepID=A0ABP9F7D2_9GAMM